MAISKLEKQLESLEKEMETATKNIDKQIDKLNEYKDKWSDVADQHEKAQAKMYADSVLGLGWEQDVLSMRDGILVDFANSYVSVEQSLSDSVVQAAHARINAINLEIEALKQLQKQRETGDGNQVDPANLSEYDTTSYKERDSIKSTYKGVSVNNSTAYTDTGTGNVKRITVSGSVSNYLTGGGSLTSSQYAASLQEYKKKKYGTGTNNAKPGIHEVAESGDEIIIDNYGRAFVAEGHQLHNFEGGEVVKNASETKELLKNNNNLIPIQSFFDNIDTSAFVPNIQNIMPKVNLPKHDIAPISRDSGMMINIGDIHLHEVSSVDSLADAIIRELPNKINQRINRKF